MDALAARIDTLEAEVQHLRAQVLTEDDITLPDRVDETEATLERIAQRLDEIESHDSGTPDMPKGTDPETASL